MRFAPPRAPCPPSSANPARNSKQPSPSDRRASTKILVDEDASGGNMYAPAGVKTNHNEFPIPDSMRAWVLGDPGQLSMTDKTMPVPKKAEVLVRIDAVAICATDLEIDRKSTRLNSSHTVIYTLSLHDALPI